MTGEEADVWREIGTGEVFDDVRRDTAKKLQRYSEHIRQS